jgi:hypothetical protein
VPAELPGPAAVRGMPTIPPEAVSSEAKQLLSAERNRNFTRPATTSEALDESMIGEGIPQAKVPVEFSGKYRVDNGPTMSMPPESGAKYTVRDLEQGALIRQAQGRTPGDSLPAPRNGDSLFAADQQAARSGRNAPTIPAEYSKPDVHSRPTIVDPMNDLQHLLERDTITPDMIDEVLGRGIERQSSAAVPSMRQRLTTMQAPDSQAITASPGHTPLVSEIPRAGKLPATEGMEDMAEAADVLHGNRMLKRQDTPDQIAQYQRAEKRAGGGAPAKRANDSDSTKKTQKPGKRK